MECKVSIIVPVYKVEEKYLERCINSLREQSLKNIEIILVDDGSPDRCGEICDNYAAKDSRICVIHKENGGLSSARNAGYYMAKGEWLMFVDGDDWIEPEMCGEMYKVGVESNVQIVMSNLCRDYGHTSTPYNIYLENNKIYKEDECKWLQEQLLHFDSCIAMAYAKLIRKDYLDYFEITHDEVLKQGAEGIEFTLRLFENLDSTIYINKPFYHYIYNENSISSSHNENNHKLVIACFEQIKRFIGASENKERLMPWLNNRMLYVIITTAISGYFSPGNKELYRIKKQKYNVYLKQPIVKEALDANMIQGLSRQRRCALFFIKRRMYVMISLMAIARKFQKKIK